MADYIYTMEIRLTPDQLKGVNLVRTIARAAGMNLYLTGGAIRDIISGFTIRDLDFTVQGNPLKLQKDLEQAGAKSPPTTRTSGRCFWLCRAMSAPKSAWREPKNMKKSGKPPVVTPARFRKICGVATSQSTRWRCR